MTLSRCQQLKTEIATARQALSDKRLGNQAIQVQTGPDMTRFAGASVAQIEAELRDLENEYRGLSCDVILGESPSETLRPRRARGPLRGPIGRR